MPDPSLSTKSPRQLAVFPSPAEATADLAARIAATIRERAAMGADCVLGLATGATPLPLYRELIRLHREEGLSFANVITFNLDEYYGLPATDSHSYHAFMRRELFSHLDLAPERTYIPDGTIHRDQIHEHCAAYEAAIEDVGGIDLQILGIGRSGHIGFNEPPTSPSSTTHLVVLDPITRQDAATSFSGIENVPTEAITMGVGTILRSRKIFLMAWGETKAEIVARSLSETPSADLPASFLQNHPDVTWLLDDPAASKIAER